MPHPLSELITARLDANDNKDPHARTTITNAEAVEIREALERLSGGMKVGSVVLVPGKYSFGSRFGRITWIGSDLAIVSIDGYPHIGINPGGCDGWAFSPDELQADHESPKAVTP